jgi:hypothetical protein
MDRFESVERDGMHFRISLERNPLPADEWTRVTTELTNMGDRPMTWMSDGCEKPGYVWGVMESTTWRPGIAQLDVARRFKDRVLDLAYREDPPVNPRLRFVTEEDVGSGSSGCADLAVAHVVQPGETLRQELVWDGQANLRWGPPPSGPVTLTGLFQSYRVGAASSSARRELELQLDAWVVNGADDTWLSPPEVVDAALADPAFLEYVTEQDGLCRCGLGNGRQEILWYRPELGAWEVGLLIWHDDPEPRMQLVHVDPRSGAIVDRVDRAWDRDADGFP